MRIEIIVTAAKRRQRWMIKNRESAATLNNKIGMTMSLSVRGYTIESHHKTILYTLSQ